MKLSEIKIICQNFSAIQEPITGKMRCKFATDDSLFCVKGEKFSCTLMMKLKPELYQVSNLDIQKSNEPFVSAPHGESWSMSRINRFLDCPRAYFLHYVLQIPETNPIEAFVDGRAFHECREALDLGLDYVLSPTLKPDHAVKLDAVLKLYDSKRPFQIKKSEYKVQFDLPEGKLIGYIDAITKDDDLVEFKYTANPENYDHLAIMKQASLYLQGYPDAQNFIVCAVQKPRNRLKKSESMKAFKERIKDEIFNTDDSIVITKFKRTDFLIDSVLDSINSTIKIIKHSIDNNLVPGKYGWSCRDCIYYSFCKTCAKCKNDCDNCEIDVASCNKIKEWNWN